MTICFIDTETTSLRHDRQAWEIAVIRDDTDHVWHVSLDDLDLANADLGSLKVGRFHDRHAEINTAGPWGESAAIEWGALREVERITRGATLVGVNPAFDAETLANRMRDNGMCPSWHYSVIDMKAMAAGWLLGVGMQAVNDGRLESIVPSELKPPWKSDALSRACGVEPPIEDERHTALGDARWAKRWYESIAGGAA